MNTTKRPIIMGSRDHDLDPANMHWALSECIAVMAAAGPILITPVTWKTRGVTQPWSPEWQAAFYMIEGLRTAFVTRFKENARKFDRYDADFAGINYLGLRRSEGVVRFHPGMEAAGREAHFLVRLALMSDIHVPRSVCVAIGELDDDDIYECKRDLEVFRRNTGRAFLMPGGSGV